MPIKHQCGNSAKNDKASSLDNSVHITQNLSRFISFEDLERSSLSRGKVVFADWQQRKAEKVAENVASQVQLWKAGFDGGVNRLTDKILEDMKQVDRAMKGVGGAVENRLLVKFVLSQFMYYRKSVEDTTVWIVGKDKQGAVHGFPVVGRFDDGYISVLKEKFQPLVDGVQLNNDVEDRYVQTVSWKGYNGNMRKEQVDFADQVFLTLTYDPKKTETIQEAWEKVSKDWNRFKSSLRRECGHFEYIWTVEAQENGYPHIHATIFGKNFLLWNGNRDTYATSGQRRKNGETATLQSLWKRGFTYVGKKDAGGQVVQPLNYMFKAISDSWGDRELCDKGFLTQAMLWFFSRRCYGISMGLQNWLKENRLSTKQDVEGNDVPLKEVRWLGLLILIGVSILKNEDLIPFLHSNTKPPP